MKKAILLSTLFCMVTTLLFGCKAPAPVKQTDDIHNLTKGYEYRAVTEYEYYVGSVDEKYTAVQGCCLAGNELFIPINKPSAIAQEFTILHVVDVETGELLRTSEPLPLDHCNDLTYIEKENVILAAHSHAPDGSNRHRYTKINPQTFEIVEVKDLPYSLFAMAYSSEKDMYASGRGDNTYDVWDGNLNPVFSREVEDANATRQGICCDDKYIYVSCWRPNKILVYDWEYNFIRTIPISFTDMPESIEPEGLFIKDGIMYASCYLGGTAFVFRLSFVLQ